MRMAGRGSTTDRRLRAQAEQANNAARQVWYDNYGDSIDAFEQWWKGGGPWPSPGQGCHRRRVDRRGVDRDGRA